jgi:thymidine kinase
MSLKFVFGTVSSGKTLKLLSDLYHYKKLKNENVVLISPLVNTRNGVGIVWSRMSKIEEKADIIIGPDDNIIDKVIDFLQLTSIVEICNIKFFIDEVQFLTVDHIYQLQKISLKNNVSCFGLRSNFKRELWTSSAKLIALSTQLECIQVPCRYCTNMANFNLKVINNEQHDGQQVILGCEESFVQVCPQCFEEKK